MERFRPSPEDLGISSKEPELKPKKSRFNLFENSIAKTIAAAATVLAVGGFTEGCAAPAAGLKDAEIHKGLNDLNGEVDDPLHYREHLQTGEYVIPNEIFNAWSKTVDKKSFGDAAAAYIDKNHLNTPQEQKEFQTRLTILGLPKSSITFYESLFASSGSIIFRESTLRNDNFLKILPHERLHKIMKTLTPEKYGRMMRVAKEMMERELETGAPAVNERHYVGKGGSGNFRMSAMLNSEEFYTYLAQDEFEPHVEKDFQKDYPQEYELFLQLKEACKLKK